MRRKTIFQLVIIAVVRIISFLVIFADKRNYLFDNIILMARSDEK